MANLNSNVHFSSLPTVNIGRSAFDRSSNHKASIKEGFLTPIYHDFHVVPGDTIMIDMAEVIHSITPLHPVLDDAYLNVDFFFVPDRLLWEDLPYFFGQVSDVPGVQTGTYTIPKSTISPLPGSLADHLGLPVSKDGSLSLTVNAMPFRGYVKIWNDFYRDQNVMPEAAFYTDGESRVAYTAQQDVNGFVDYSDPFVGIDQAVNGSYLLPVAKFHDYFTSSLPFRQRSETPIGVPVSGIAPVISTDLANVMNSQVRSAVSEKYGAQVYPTQQRIFNMNDSSLGTEVSLANNRNVVTAETPSGLKGATTTGAAYTGSEDQEYYLMTNNQQAMLDLGSVSIDVNDLRLAFATQRFLEKSAAYGSRYNEMIYGQFGVISPDQRLQRAECIGRRKIRIGMQQVLQTSQTADQETPLGNKGAMSITADVAPNLVTYSAVEFGMVIGVASIRVQHSYQQGMDRAWKRESMYDYYFPAFANIGNMPVYNYEIYADGTSEDDEIFGFQEPYAYLRYRQNTVAGLLRSASESGFDIWHYADDYAERPRLSPEWMAEGQNVDRTLAYQESDQFYGIFSFKEKWFRPLPVYGEPSYLFQKW